MRIAVIGTGISGSLVARLLATRYEVTVFEASSTPGGHANTVAIEAFGHSFAVDTGFMVFNRRTYPNFCQLLDILGIDSRPSDMSFSVHCSRTGLEYQGSSLSGLFAQRRNIIRPSFLRMIADIVRFNRAGYRAAKQNAIPQEQTVDTFLKTCRTGKRFFENYLQPMAAAIWSSDPAAIRDFPADFLIGFFANHGLLQIRDRPQWRTVEGGSRNYVNALLKPITDRIRLECPVEAVFRVGDSVLVRTRQGQSEQFDQVVFATHADQTLNLLQPATELEQLILSAFPYQRNECVLHTDTRLLPKRQRAWASWNYHIPLEETRAPAVTYDLSRLQGHDSPRPILLTLNASAEIDTTKVIHRMTYCHPAFGQQSLSAQRRWSQISGRNRAHFCGAYWGYGFHEDGVNSALAVTGQFEIGLKACTAACTKEASRTVAINQ
ncbi:MAG: FAD-dependent oxidoreductase [Pirellulales bacterium]|nr:FAD-dependent oxidoreductase [Pirellulales bacterium]